MSKTQKDFEKYSKILTEQQKDVLKAKKELDELLYRTDAHGNILYGKKGKPVIAFFRVLRNLGKIVALIEYIFKPLEK